MITPYAQHLLTAKASRESTARLLRKFEGAGVTFPPSLAAPVAQPVKPRRPYRQREGKNMRAIRAWLATAQSGDVCSHKSLGLPAEARKAFLILIATEELLPHEKGCKGRIGSVATYCKP